jgi:hypothetical protein
VLACEAFSKKIRYSSCRWPIINAVETIDDIAVQTPWLFDLQERQLSTTGNGNLEKVRRSGRLRERSGSLASCNYDLLGSNISPRGSLNESEEPPWFLNGKTQLI